MINTKSKYQFFFEFLSFTLNYKLPLFFILIIGSLLSALINYQKSTIYKLNSTISLNQDSVLLLDNLNEIITADIKKQLTVFNSIGSSDLYKLISDKIKIQSYLFDNFDNYNFSSNKYDYFSRRNMQFSTSGSSVLINATLFGKDDAENSVIFFNETLEKYLNTLSTDIKLSISKFEEFYNSARDLRLDTNNQFDEIFNSRLIKKLKIALKIAKKNNIIDVIEDQGICTASSLHGVNYLERQIREIEKDLNLCSKVDQKYLLKRLYNNENYFKFDYSLNDFNKKIGDKNLFIHKHVISKNENFSQSIIRYLLSGFLITFLLSLLVLYVLYEYKKFKNN